MRILHCATTTKKSLSWVREIAHAHRPDIGVCAGTHIEQAPEITEAIGIDILHNPGVHDDRTSFETSYGRRYRIDPGYPYLDRTVHIGGSTLLLLDTADGTVTPQQRMWLESVLTDTNIDVVRGAVALDVVLFSSFPIFPPTEGTIEGEGRGESRLLDEPGPLQELLLGFSRGPLRLSVFYCEENEESHTVVAGIHQYGTPPAEVGVRMIRIDRFEPIESVMIYRTEVSNRD